MVSVTVPPTVTASGSVRLTLPVKVVMGPTAPVGRNPARYNTMSENVSAFSPCRSTMRKVPLPLLTKSPETRLAPRTPFTMARMMPTMSLNCL